MTNSICKDSHKAQKTSTPIKYERCYLSSRLSMIKKKKKREKTVEVKRRGRGRGGGIELQVLTKCVSPIYHNFFFHLVAASVFKEDGWHKMSSFPPDAFCSGKCVRHGIILSLYYFVAYVCHRPRMHVSYFFPPLFFFFSALLALAHHTKGSLECFWLRVSAHTKFITLWRGAVRRLSIL